MPYVTSLAIFFYICMVCESEMSVRRLISVITSFCLLAGCEFGLSADSFEFSFKIGKSTVDTTLYNNARACARIVNAFLFLPQDARISVKAYSSPDGRLSRNRQLSQFRATSVRDFILSLSSAPDYSRIDLITVDEDWEGVKSYLKRSDKEWKQEALDIINAPSGDKKALLQDLWVGEAWDDLMKNCFPSLRRVSVEIENNALQVPEGLVDGPEVLFSQGGSRVPSSSYNSLKELASTAANTLYIYIKASPEGTQEGNEALSMKRAARIEAFLRQYGYAGDVSVEYRGEDWDGLLEAVKAATDMPDKESVIEILQDGSLDRASRKKALQALSYGKTWLRLMDTEMSGLRKAIVSPNMILK